MKISKITMLVASVILAAAFQAVNAEAHAKSSFLIASSVQSSENVEGHKPNDVTPISQDPLVSPDLTKKVKKKAPEGGTPPLLVPKRIGDWRHDGVSQVPVLFQYMLALAWILMLASMPFLMPIFDKQPVTTTQYVVGASMLLVLFGGFYLFTNIILFQSAHFDGIRTLTMIECIYFMAQVITTVGYGDITPAKIRGQVFVAMYVLGALFIISMLISDITNHVIATAKAYREKVAVKEAAKRTPRTPQQVSVSHLLHVEKPSAKGLITALLAFAVIDVIWIAFFSLHPDEGKTVFQALYMSVITLSTVGFGYFTPVTESGMIFGAFFMLFGSAALVNVITNFTELMVKMNEWERYRPEKMTDALITLEGLTNGAEMVSEAQFLEFTLLQMKLVSKSELDCIHQAFEQMRPEKGPVRRVPFKAIQQVLSEKELASSRT